MKIQDLYETPMLIGDHDFDPTIDGFDLSDSVENTKAYEKITTSGNSNQLEKHNDSQYLYQYGDKIVLLDIVDKKVDYYVKIYQGKFKITGKYATQVEVWRTKERAVYGVVKKVFFDYILKSHNTVLSDSLQTNEGRGLWVNLVSYAFEKNLNVYVVDLNTGTLTKINNDSEYRNNISKFYSTKKSSEMVRILISTIEYESVKPI
jgi:hypothetical protein